MSETPASTPSRLSGRQWLFCAIAALAFFFDIYELLMLPLVVRPALAELLGAAPGSPLFNRWTGLLFYLPAVCGGVFGLLGGYLTDRFGRRRVLVWSILLYAGSAFGAAFATSASALLLLRCTTFVGVCVEFVAGVAWLAELFPEPRLREKVLGYTQAFSSLGGLAVSAVYGLVVKLGPSLPEIAGGHQAWRYTLISGLIPALPLLLVRPWLPESPLWQQERQRTRPSLGELFTPGLLRTTLVAALLTAVSYGLAFGALQQTPRIVPGLADVKDLTPQAREFAVSQVQMAQEVGGLVGRTLLAALALVVVSRRRLLQIFLVPATLVLPLIYWLAPGQGWGFLAAGVFAGGLLTIGQHSFWGNYLPRVYPTHLRGTGESFAANVGGRMIGTAAALASTQLASAFSGAGPAVALAHACALVALGVGLVGIVASFWLPEPDPLAKTE
ncbi:MAG: MFS transporter [Thermoanaerobaculia bacterium]